MICQTDHYAVVYIPKKHDSDNFFFLVSVKLKITTSSFKNRLTDLSDQNENKNNDFYCWIIFYVPFLLALFLV